MKKHMILNLLLFANSILLIMYMGLTINRYMAFNATGTVSLFLSSLMLIDITYISSCNVRENKVISLFCGLLALHSWYILLSAWGSAHTSMAFSALSPVIWYVSINFILMFLFQGGGYRFKKTVGICLAGTCICSLIGLLVSDEIFALFYGIQFLTGLLCFIFIVVFHRKMTAFVIKAEWKCILFSLTCELKVCSTKKPWNPTAPPALPAVPELSALCVIRAPALKGGKNVSENNA